jgi:hypothetical protein
LLFSGLIEICIYKTLAGPALPHGNEWWKIRKTDDRTSLSAEICFSRRASEYTFPKLSNEEIIRKIQIPQITGFKFLSSHRS